MKTILVVDDEQDIRDTVKTILDKNGYRVLLAVDGDDCLKKLKNSKVDLILLDIMMPGTPVKVILKKIKNIPVIFLTVVRTSEVEKESMLDNKNILGFIQKPFSAEHLLGEVKKLVG